MAGRPLFWPSCVKRGFVIVSIDYRLAPETKLPGIIEDVQDAWRWLRQEGPKQFGIDPDRIATAGGSAGGYLTLMTGFCLEPRPRALVSYYGYGDITTPWYSKPDAFYRRQPLVPKDEAYRCVGNRVLSEPPTPNRRGRFYLYCRQHGIWPNEVAGHDPLAEPKWFDPYCPIRNVTAKYPPAMLIHGTADTDVPYAESKNMAARLAEAKVKHELITVDGGRSWADRAPSRTRWLRLPGRPPSSSKRIPRSADRSPRRYNRKNRRRTPMRKTTIILLTALMGSVLLGFGDARRARAEIKLEMPKEAFGFSGTLSAEVVKEPDKIYGWFQIKVVKVLSFAGNNKSKLRTPEALTKVWKASAWPSWASRAWRNSRWATW